MARRTLVAVTLTAWLVLGLSAAYAYLRNYDLHRGFTPLKTPAGIPRGRVETVKFYSPSVHRVDRYMVYLPPHYAWAARHGRRFPVMYLLHGAPGLMSAFTEIDAIDVRANVMIAHHRIRPMILVMPAGEQGFHTDTEWANARAGLWMNFLLDVVHNVDSRFATRAHRRYRAIAGASEGAYGAVNVGLHHVGEFSIIQSWSGYFTQTPTGPFADVPFSEIAANSPADYVASLAPEIHRLGLRAWLLQGRSDVQNPAALRSFAAALHAAGAEVRYGFFPGGHDWGLWRAQTPRMLVAASRWFGQRPGSHVGFGHVGRALSPAARLRILARHCLSPRRQRYRRAWCRAYHAALGLPVSAARAGAPRGGSTLARAGSTARRSARPRTARSGATPRRRSALGRTARSQPGSAGRGRRRRS
jgi:enterochelin esterase-like enzyme